MIDLAEMLRVFAKHYDPTDRSARITYKHPDQTLNLSFGIVQDNNDPDKMGSPNRMVVLGSIYTPQNKIDPGENSENQKKFFVSRSGSRIEFDDTEGAEKLTFATADGKMRFVLSTEHGMEIVNEDGGINIECDALTIEADTVLIEAEETFSLEATGLTLTSSEGISITADEETVLSCSEIALQGSSGVTAGAKQIAAQDNQVVGNDMHIVMVSSPSGQVPVPMPHPFVGKLNDELSDDVRINGKKAAVIGCQATNCDDTGMQNQSTVVAVGASVVLPIMIPGMDPLTFEQDGGFMINTRNLIAEPSQPGPPIQQSLSNPAWSSSSAKVGEELTLSVTCTDLHANATIYFTIWEEGFNPDVDLPVAKVMRPNRGGSAEATWTSNYKPEDWPDPFTEKPKFVFTANGFKCAEVTISAMEMGQDCT